MDICVASNVFAIYDSTIKLLSMSTGAHVKMFFWGVYLGVDLDLLVHFIYDVWMFTALDSYCHFLFPDFFILVVQRIWLVTTSGTPFHMFVTQVASSAKCYSSLLSVFLPVVFLIYRSSLYILSSNDYIPWFAFHLLSGVFW